MHQITRFKVDVCTLGIPIAFFRQSVLLRYDWCRIHDTLLTVSGLRWRLVLMQ
jgi:hypothetical protein